MMSTIIYFIVAAAARPPLSSPNILAASECTIFVPAKVPQERYTGLFNRARGLNSDGLEVEALLDLLLAPAFVPCCGVCRRTSAGSGCGYVGGDVSVHANSVPGEAFSVSLRESC